MIFGRHVYGAGGLYPPPPVTRPPPEELYSPEYYVNTCALVELHKCTLLGVRVWMIRGIVLSWDRTLLSWFLMEFMVSEWEK